MQKKATWLLPQGVEEVLPQEALQLETLRRQLLDTFGNWGYQLVTPPLIDFAQSLLVGRGQDLDLATFKLTDQMSGETLGIRPDITPQVARIDAHTIKHSAPSRLCYAGDTLRTVSHNLENSRNQTQIGAELYGDASIDSDAEIISLMLEMLEVATIDGVHLDLGHVGIYRGLAAAAGLTSTQESRLFAVLQNKAITDAKLLLDSFAIAPKFTDLFINLAKISGNSDMLAVAKQQFTGVSTAVDQAFAQLESITSLLQNNFPALPISFDLAQLRGYDYHTGIVFAAFVAEVGREIARGGRYDNIGEFFGTARPATGFSADLKLLARLAPVASPSQLVYAPNSQDPSLAEAISQLRAKGIAVVRQLSKNDTINCTDHLEKHGEQWLLRPTT